MGVHHLVEAYDVRLEAERRSHVCSGDTGPCGALTELARDTTLLLCEGERR